MQFIPNLNLNYINTNLQIQLSFLLCSLFLPLILRSFNNSLQLKMIKSNRKPNDSIINSGYRNRLKQYADSQNQNPNSQKRSQISDKVNSKASQKSRSLSQQRAFNSKAGTSNIKNVQAQSQVQRYYSSNISQQQKRLVKERLPSEPFAEIDKSQAPSDVNTQIQALNRLREQYQILKQVTSDDEFKIESRVLNNNNQSKISKSNGQQSTLRRYIYESRDSVPVQIIKNKKHQNKSGGIKSSVNKGNKPALNRNPEQQENNSQLSEEEPSEQLLQQQKQFLQRQSRNERTKQQAHPKLSIQKFIANQQYLVQINFLQSSLTQSALKIEELLVESIKNKEKLKSYQFFVQKAHRFENELKLSRENEKLLSRELEIKDDQIKRFQKRVRIMKQTQEMVEKESQIKDNQISALQKAVVNYRNRTIQFVNASKQQENISKVEQAYRQAMEKINKISEQAQLLKQEKTLLRKQFDNQLKRTQIFAEQMKKSSVYQTQNLKSYYSEVNDSLKSQLLIAQEKVYQLESKYQKAYFQLEMEQSKNSRLQQTLSTKLQQLKYTSSINSYRQRQERQEQDKILQLDHLQMLQLQQSEQAKQQIQELKRQINKLHQELSFISSQTKNGQTGNNLNQEDSLKQRIDRKNSNLSVLNSNKNKNELQNKIRQLEEMISQNQQTIRIQNQYKQSFLQEIQTLKENHQKLIKDNHELKGINSKLKNNFISKQQYLILQNQKLKLQSELERMKRNQGIALQHMNLSRNLPNFMSNSSSNSFSSPAAQFVGSFENQQLILNLNSIKEQYRKLQSSYLQKAKHHQKFKLQFSQITQELKQTQQTVNYYEKELTQLRNYSNQLQQKMHEKQLKLIELISISENNKAYNQKISELQKCIVSLQIKLKQKQHEMANKQFQCKKNLNDQKQISNQLKLELSSLNLQKFNIKNIFQEQSRNFSAQVQNYQKELKIIKAQFQNQQKHYQELNRADKEIMGKQIHLLEQRLYEVMKEKQKLMEDTIKVAHLEHQLKALTIKERNNRKLTQNMDHLWMIKQAQYWNINQILGLFKQGFLNERQFQNPKKQQAHLIQSNN